MLGPESAAPCYPCRRHAMVPGRCSVSLGWAGRPCGGMWGLHRWPKATADKPSCVGVGVGGVGQYLLLQAAEPDSSQPLPVPKLQPLPHHTYSASLCPLSSFGGLRQ